VTTWEVVQGVTEFLPISSDGHLVLFQTFLSVNPPGIVFEVGLHVATLISILIAFRDRVRDLLVGLWRRDPVALRYAVLIVVGSIPAGIVGVFFNDALEALFESPVAAGLGLIFTGTVLWTSKAALPRATGGTVPGWPAALLIGVGQALAIAPGISRSGMTIVTALWLGVEAREAAAFSFLMAIPAIGGAAVLELPNLAGSGVPLGQMLAGGVVACLTGILAIRTLVVLLTRQAFHVFAPYCVTVGALFLVYLGLR